MAQNFFQMMADRFRGAGINTPPQRQVTLPTTPQTNFFSLIASRHGGSVLPPPGSPERIAQAQRLAAEAEEKARRAASPFTIARKTIIGTLGEVGRIGQDIARNIASAGVTLAKPLGGKEQVSAQDFPELLRPVVQKIFRNEPIKSIEQRIAEAELDIRRVGEGIERGGDVRILGRRIAPQVGSILKEHATPLAFAGVLGSIGLDLTPFGGLEKNVTKQIVKQTTREGALKLLKQGLKVSGEVAERFADDVVKTKSPKGAEILLKRIAEEQEKLIGKVGQAIKQAKPKVKRITPKTPIKGVKLTEEGLVEVPTDPFKKLRRERGFITSAKEAVPELRIAGQYIPRRTDRLAIKARNLIKDDIETAEKLALTGTDDKAVATAAELIKHYNDLAKATKTKAEANAFYDKAAEIVNEIAPKLTEQGRAIQAAAILGRETPEGQLRFAARLIAKYNKEVEATKGGFLGLKKKIPELTGEQAESILKQMEKIKKMPDGVDKAMAFKKLQDEIADLIPAPLYKKLINLWKAGLLTGLKTSGLNTLSNLFHGVSETIKDIPASAVDSVASLFTGKRTVVFTLRGTPKGIKEGFAKGLRYMKTGFDERNMKIKFDWKRVSFGKSKFAKTLQKYEETVFRLMGAEDQPFYYAAKARSIASQAIAQGKNKGLKGKELEKFVNELIQNPTDEMLKYAVNDAEIAVFQNRTLLGNIARTIQRAPGGEIVVPFGHTPSAVAMQIINYSPVGIVKTIVENIGKGRFDQRLFAQGIGRGITGTAAIFIGMQMYKKDLISLDWPQSERERNQWELEGRKANSFKSPDGKWRSVLVLGPPGMLLVLGGQLQKFIDKNGSLSQALPEATSATAKSFTEQTFLVGVNNFAKALNDPGRYAANVASRTFGSIIPTFVSDVARATDPLERRTFVRSEGFLAPTKARVPGLRRTLEPRVDILGSPLSRSGNALETMLDPTRPTRIKSNAVIEELRRLLNADYLATPTDFADEKSYTDVLTPAQITKLQEQAGMILEEKLKNLFASDKYKKLDDEEKAKVIQDFTHKARVVARAAMVEELTQDLSGEEFKAKMSELKKSGFMTREVFNKWKELFY